MYDFLQKGGIDMGDLSLHHGIGSLFRGQTSELDRFYTSILPEQFFQTQNEQCSEKRLFCAVFINALSDFSKGVVSTNRYARRLKKEVEDWFFSDDEKWFASFQNICSMFNLDPCYIRKGLRQIERSLLQKMSEGTLRKADITKPRTSVKKIGEKVTSSMNTINKFPKAT